MESRLGNPRNHAGEIFVGKRKPIACEPSQSLSGLQPVAGGGGLPANLVFRDAVLHWWDTHAGYLRRGNEPMEWE